MRDMACVLAPSGNEIITEKEFAHWWEDHCALRESGKSFIDLLRQHVAKRQGFANFRQLAIVCQESTLGRDSPWDNLRPLVAIRRSYAENSEGDIQACVQLMEAARGGLINDVVQLLERPFDPNMTYTLAEGRRTVTALHLAAANGHQDVVCVLLESGAEKDKADNKGCTPIFIASANGHEEVVRFLLQMGADKDKATHRGRTPIFAAAKGHLNVVLCLLQAGADKDKVDDDGRSPMFIAAARGHEEVVRVLLQAGADKDKAMGGITPMFAAACKGHRALASFLLSFGIDCSRR